MCVYVWVEQSWLFTGLHFMEAFKPAHGKGLRHTLSPQDHNTPNKELAAVDPLYHKCK